MNVWHDSRAPYLRYAADLRARIMSGDLPTEGTDRLPSIAQLMTEYGTSSTSVIQRALGVLSDEGLVQAQHGKGTVVIAKPATAILVTPEIDLGDDEDKLRYDLLEVGEVPSPADIAAQLGIGRGDLVALRKMVGTRRTSGLRVELVWNYYPVEAARGTPLAARRKMVGGSKAYFESVGRFQTEMDDVVTGRAPTQEEAEILNLPGETFVLRTLRRIVDQDGAPMEVTVLVQGTHLFASRYHRTLR